MFSIMKRMGVLSLQTKPEMVKGPEQRHSRPAESLTKSACYVSENLTCQAHLCKQPGTQIAVTSAWIAAWSRDQGEPNPWLVRKPPPLRRHHSKPREEG